MIPPDATPIEELPPANRLESMALGKRLRLLALVVLVIALPWLALHLYGMRIAALSMAGTESFYPDLSMPMMLSMTFGLLSLALIGSRRVIAARSPGIAAAAGLLLIPAAAALSLLWLVSDLVFVQPDITLAADALFCGERVPWSAISGVQLEDGWRGREYVRLELDAGRVPWPSALMGRDSVSCEITGQNVDHALIYDAIWDHWAARVAASEETAPETVAAQVPVGTSEKDAIALFGAPFVMRAKEGDTFYYASPRGGTGGWRLVAIYFDKDGRARRVADYRRQGRKFIDAAGGSPLPFTDAVVVEIGRASCRERV
jgi:hypothetical protein